MHIPDGFLDTKTLVATAVLSSAGLAAAWRSVKKEVPPQKVPLLGVAAAFVFAAQMLNFPVAGGTSGHLMGAVLVSVLLGPGAAAIVMGTVLLVQCFLFADGGMLALGANMFNMALCAVISGYALYSLLRRILSGGWGRTVSVAVASWASVVVSSLCSAGELAWSGTVPWSTVFPAMMGVHAVIGIGEAVITCMVVTAITVARPDLLIRNASSAETRAPGAIMALGLATAVGMVVFISPFASAWPDGLEMVASRLGFSQRAMQLQVQPQFMPDYAVSGFSSSILATVVAGSLGVLVVLVFMAALSRVINSKS